jgi:hypothetical protein
MTKIINYPKKQTPKRLHNMGCHIHGRDNKFLKANIKGLKCDVIKKLKASMLLGRRPKNPLKSIEGCYSMT